MKRCALLTAPTSFTTAVIFKSGTPESLAADEEVRRIYLGTEFRLD